MDKLKDSTLVWLTIGCREQSDRIKYGLELLSRIKSLTCFFDDAADKLIQASQIIRETTEINECLNEAMGDKKEVIWRNAMAIKGLKSLKERD